MDYVIHFPRLPLLNILTSYQGEQLNYDNHHLWQEYIKEVAQLMLTPNGWYQKFVWDTYSDSDKAQMEVRARGLGWGKNTN